MCWTTDRGASEAAVAVAAAGRSSDSDSFRDRPIHTNDENNNNSPVACPVARRYRHAKDENDRSNKVVHPSVRSLVPFVFVDRLLCSNPNNHHGMFRPDIFSIERKNSTNHRLCGSGVGSRDNEKHHHQPQLHRIGSVLCYCCCFHA